MNDEEERLSFSDYLTMLIDTYISLDLSSWQSIMGLFVAFLLNTIFIIVRYLYADSYSTIEYILMILSILNVIYLWLWSYKIYHFFSQNIDETPNIPNVNLVGIDLPWYARNRLGYYMYQQYYELNYDKPYKEGQKVWEIYIWNPNKFSLNLFYGFSPVQVGIFMLMNKGTEIYSIILVGFLAIQMHFYTEKFISLIRDKEIIFREVQREYDMKFVKPRVFRQRKNVETQTIQTEITRELLYHKPDEERYKYPRRFDNPWVTDANSAGTTL
ncbi:hypothetical protein C1645_747942 [Glomus cerebriforme]|uniref:Uncharacterized protein n=1 Tax=Glomus cerebriforme TaxID=658196 RepID=A0A397TLI6_9GLOM|nr:hypothetical protein C1645_747942 [Glomus cerebriforme]